jgi:hypothetical protein
MKVFRMAAALALLAGAACLAGPVSAQQMPNINLLGDGPSKTDDEKAADAEREKAYKDTLKKIPDAKASNDPWGGMRSDPPKAAQPKASASASKTSASAKKTKTGPSTN